jgi:hypothetical protein
MWLLVVLWPRLLLLLLLLLPIRPRPLPLLCVLLLLKEPRLLQLLRRRRPQRLILLLRSLGRLPLLQSLHTAMLLLICLPVQWRPLPCCCSSACVNGPPAVRQLYVIITV